MPVELAEKLYTVEEFEALSDFDTFELLDGVPVEKAMGNRSSSVTGNLWCLLAPFVKQHKLGRVYDAESGYVLFPEMSTSSR